MLLRPCRQTKTECLTYSSPAVVIRPITRPFINFFSPFERNEAQDHAPTIGCHYFRVLGPPLSGSGVETFDGLLIHLITV